MSDSQIIDILSQDFFNLTGFITPIFRAIGWGLIKLMASLSNKIEGIVNKIYSLNGFFSSKYIDELLHNLFPIIWGILAISILFLGFQIMFNRDFKIDGVIKNTLIAFSIILILPLGMSHLSKITNTAINGLKSEYKFSANKIIKENVYDLYYLDSTNFKQGLTINNRFSTEDICNLNINEEVDTSKVKNKDVFSSKIGIDVNGKKTKDSLEKGMFNLFDENYYRYSFNFWTILLIIGCTTFTLIITSIKIARIIFELGFVKLFGVLYAVSDISTGQKNKEIIRCVVSNFIILFIISLLLKLYLLFSTWASQSSEGLVQIILLIGGSLAVIDGPNIIERILGIDSGVKDGWSTMVGLNSTFDTISRINGGMKNVVGGVINKASSLGSGAIGMVNGFKEGIKSLEEQMDGDSNLSNFINDNGSLYEEMKNECENESMNNFDNLNNNNKSLESELGSQVENKPLESEVKNQANNNLLEKSHIEHRTLSEHIKYRFENKQLVKNAKQSYSIGRNTGVKAGAKMASLIRSRKNK